MSTFTVPFDSSPPSTPNGTPQIFKFRPPYSDMSDHPSTTPAGPPPHSSTASFTPAGAPPSNAFGTSQFSSGVSKLKFTRAMDDSLSSTVPPPPSAFRPPPRTKNGTPAKLFGKSLFTVPSSTPLSASDSFSQSGGQGTDDEAVEEEEMEEEQELEEYDEQDESLPLSGRESRYGKPGTPAFRGFTSINAGPILRSQSSIPSRNRENVKRSKLQATARKQDIPPKISQLPREGQEEVIPGIARDLASRTASAPLTEPNDLILQTEDLVVQINEDIENSPEADSVQAVLAVRTNELTRFWYSFNEEKSGAGPRDSIGPSDAASGLEKAIFLSTLLLALRHPPIQQSQPQNTMRSSNPNHSLVVSALSPAPIPQILLDWLDRYHVSYHTLLHEVRAAQPNCTAHNLFWDAVQALLLRGKLQDVRQLFGEADFKYAVSALDDGAEEVGYAGSQLQTVQGAIYRAQQILEACPGLVEGEWHMDGSDWELYRKRVATELEYLGQSAEGRADEDSEAFQAENFGIRRNMDLLMKPAGRWPKRLPWSIYQQLKITYGILLGSTEEIIAQSQDWVEAAMALTIWWDGSEDDSVSSWRLSVSRSQERNNRQYTGDPYLSRLSAAFLCVTDPDDKESFQVNTMSLVEVGLACVLQGNVGGVVSSLRALSLPVAAATAEIGALAGWLEASGSSNPNGLDEEDLIVLSYAAPAHKINKDEVLLGYAEALFDREELHSEDGTVVEGWELSITLTMRLDDRELAHTTVTNFLDHLHLVSQTRMDKLVGLCTDLGLEDEAQKVSERFADHLANNTDNYGTALICYARAHAATKIKQLIDLLVSYCLVQSAAYPPANELDYNLRVLVETPKMALAGLAEADPQAAKILQFSLAGYACLRRFYSLRDEEVISKKQNRKPVMRPLTCRRAAAKALLAVINSAADSIYGGLYDAERESAIQVDGLLTLLGEATAFLSTSQQKPGFTAAQMYDILAAVEDLQTVNTRVYDAMEECLQASLRNYHGSAPPSPRAMLKKSVSSGTNSNFSFSMMGSEMLASAGGKSIGSSGVLVGGEVVERGWDWRAAFKGEGVKGKDVLRVLRMGIAKDLSMAVLEEGMR